MNDERIRIKYPILNAEESEWGNPLSSDDRESVGATDSTRLSSLRDCALIATPQASSGAARPSKAEAARTLSLQAVSRAVRAAFANLRASVLARLSERRRR